jgi:4-diphosphocytidyl-2-C-methyl-D-erythritol kinase
MLDSSLRLAPWRVSASHETLVAVAPAKINLTLEIVGKLANGYHALESLMLAVDWFDTLEFRRTDRELSLVCDAPGVPCDSRNLMWKAAEALRQQVGVSHGVAMRLTKRIPHEAGLGGGSSDAATTLLALNQLWSLQLSVAELATIAATVGSDVAFFLSAPAAWCTGRGEIVTPVSVGRTLDIVIVKPNRGLSTKLVYDRLVLPSPPIDRQVACEALRTGDVMGLSRLVMNRLEESAFGLEPSVAKLCERLRQLHPLVAQMSGSGSAVFALCRDAEEATRIATAIRTDSNFSSLQVAVCRSWPL